MGSSLELLSGLRRQGGGGQGPTPGGGGGPRLRRGGGPIGLGPVLSSPAGGGEGPGC